MTVADLENPQLVAVKRSSSVLSCGLGQHKLHFRSVSGIGGKVMREGGNLFYILLFYCLGLTDEGGILFHYLLEFR